MCDIKVTLEFIEFEIRQAASDLFKMRSPFSLSSIFFRISVASRIISDILNLPSICSNFPFAKQ